jgi:hypothetical protein
MRTYVLLIIAVSAVPLAWATRFLIPASTPPLCTPAPTTLAPMMPQPVSAVGAGLGVLGVPVSAMASTTTAATSTTYHSSAVYDYVRTSRRYVSAQGDEIDVQFTVQGSQRSSGSSRGPVDFALVLAGPEGVAAARLQTSFATLLSEVQQDDRFAVIDFDGRAPRKALPLTSMDEKGRLAADTAMASAHMGDGAAITPAIEEAVRALQDRPPTRSRPRTIVVVTDPRHESELASPAFAQLLDTLTGQNIHLIVERTSPELGLLRVDRSTTRTYEPFDEPAKALRDALTDVWGIVGKEASLQIVPEPGMEVTQITGAHGSEQGGTWVVPIGAIAAGEKRTILAHFRLPPGPSGKWKIAKTILGYDDQLNGDGYRTTNSSVHVEATTDVALIQGSVDRTVLSTNGSGALAGLAN